MRRLAAGRKELPALASELVGVTAALANNITRVARKGKGVVRLGVPETAKAPVAAALAARHTGPALILVPTPARANAVYEELSLYLEDVPLARLAERESLPYELVRDDRAVPLDRSRALNLLQGAGRALVVASWAALSERCAPPDAEAAGIEITQGARLQPEALARALEERGYAASIVADEPGRFARRGGIFDVFGAAAEGPIRIEFFGDDVESIRSVDVVTQRSIARAEQVHLAPMATGTHQAHAAAAALRDRIDGESDSADIVREQLELIASGERSAYAGFLEPLLSDTTGLDHVAADALVIFDDAEDGADNLASIAEYEDRTRAELEDRGAIPSGLPALRKDPQRPRRICSRIESDIGVCMDVDCDICPSFSSSVMRASKAAIRSSIPGTAAARIRAGNARTAGKMVTNRRRVNTMSSPASGVIRESGAL